MAEKSHIESWMLYRAVGGRLAFVVVKLTEEKDLRWSSSYGAHSREALVV